MSQIGTKPIQSRAQLFPCPHYVFCDIFNCRGLAKWFVGRPDGPRQCTFKLCDNCAKDLLHIVPEGLRDENYLGQLQNEELRAEVRAELEAEYGEKYSALQDEIQELKLQIEEGVTQEDLDSPDIITNPTDQISGAHPLLTEQPDNPLGSTQIFRCLDCNYEAFSADELVEHKKEHDAQPSEPTPQTIVDTPEPDPNKPKRLTPQERLAQRVGGPK